LQDSNSWGSEQWSSGQPAEALRVDFDS
jgi:hypothetical protein